jgi:IS605 OrfB family transposase
VILVYRYRVKSLTGLLDRQARAVNFVWNYCNDAQKHERAWGKRWPSGFDLNKLTTGSSKELGIHSGTVNATCEQYAKSRRQHKRPWLRYRGRKSLGWVPFKGRDLHCDGDAFRFNGHRFRVFLSRPLPVGAIVKDGSSFSQDARGRWYLNVTIELEAAVARTDGAGVGIDLGLKDFAVLSTGEAVAAPRIFRKYEAKLAVAQRAKHKGTAKKIQAKVADKRRDFLHKLSTRLVRDFRYIAVGDVSAARLAKTSMAKSVLDAGWSNFRQMLAYKAMRHGAFYEEVDERFSTQTCSNCGVVGGPKGLEGLVVREWTCGECGAVHDRDVNSARNILRSGRGAPAQGIPAL